MKTLSFLVPLCAVSFIVEPANAEIFRMKCTTSDINSDVSLLITRNSAAKCAQESGSEEDKDYVFCASMNYSTVSKGSESSINFSVTCYGHQTNEKQQLSCIGFNGPFAAFSMMVNDNYNFTSTMTLTLGDEDSNNNVYIVKGSCDEA